jgi:hypothetical protein
LARARTCAAAACLSAFVVVAALARMALDQVDLSLRLRLSMACQRMMT